VQREPFLVEHLADLCLHLARHYIKNSETAALAAIQRQDVVGALEVE
jgi:hypothetical protein